MKFGIISSLSLALGLASCGQGERVEITETRTATKYRPLPVAAADDMERLGIPKKPQDLENPLIWTVPEGWIDRPQSKMRILNYAFGPEGEGECYVTILEGSGGGVLPNLNRWYGQMGQEAPSDLSGIEMRPLLGAEGFFVDISGDYSRMGATEPLADQRLLGLVQDFQQFIVFVKLIGPADLVAAEVEHFHEFCASVKIRR